MAQIIDIGEVVKQKTGKRLPKPILSLIAKTIQLKKINSLITRYGDDYQGAEFGGKVVDDLNVTTTVKGLENIPQGEKIIFVSNHHLGALEALAMGRHLNEVFKDNINFITNEILRYISPLKDIFVPVNVGANRQERRHLQMIEELFESDKQIVMFPAGTIARRNNGVVQDSQWKKMFVAKARQYKRTIVPIYCSGQSSEFFLKFSNFRKKIGIKSNLELVLIPREVFKYEGKHIDIIIGKPIDYQSLTKDQSDLQHAQRIKDIVYSLPK